MISYDTHTEYGDMFFSANSLDTKHLYLYVNFLFEIGVKYIVVSTTVQNAIIRYTIHSYDIASTVQYMDNSASVTEKSKKYITILNGTPIDVSRSVADSILNITKRYKNA